MKKFTLAVLAVFATTACTLAEPADEWYRQQQQQQAEWYRKNQQPQSSWYQ